MSDAHRPHDIPVDEMADYLRLYLDETGEQLDQLVQVLLALETEPADGKLLHEAFRLVHSIKGSAALMGFDQITVLVHHLESLFERLRSGSRRYDASMTDVALRCIDHLRGCNARLRRGEPLGGDAGLLDEVKALETAAVSQPAVRPEAPTPPAAPAPAAPEESRPAVGAAPSGDAAGGEAGRPGDSDGEEHRLRVTVRFQAGLPLVELRAELVLARLAAVGTVLDTVPPRDRLAAAGDLRALVVVLATVAPPAAVCTAADADGVEGVDVEAVAAAAEAAEPRAADRPAAAAVGSTMRVDVGRLDALLNLAGELVLQRSRFAKVVADLAPPFRKSALPGRMAAVAESLRELADRVRSGAAAEDLATGLEVQLAVLDEQVQAVREAQRHVARLVENTDRLARLSDQVQRGVLRTRMVPVAPLFNRFRRSVRDIAAELGKQVRLELVGETTELDKRTIDELADPLVHLVRNAVDHGIEPPHVRAARGKPETATVTLAAEHRGNTVQITVHDDGGGIDRRRIRQRIVERGLLPADQAALLGDDELLEVIWQPGFSTASRVSDISGRGVGMDIVRTRIAALGGTVEVRTVEGAGTTFVIRLPLTLAIARCLLFRVPQGVFAASLDDVREIVALDPGRVVDVRGRRSCEIRGAYLPLVSIDEVFTWADPPAPRPAGGFVVVLQSGPRKVGLAVEELLGREDLVVKSLADNFLSLRGLGGAGILAEGTVCLLLDAASVVGLATRVGPAAVAGADPRPVPDAAGASA